MTTVTSANPGNLVVPLSAIIDQLQGKLGAADLNALLLAVVGQKKNEVRPGDLITADLFNQILADLDDLHLRVSALEGNATQASIHILRIDGPTPIRVLSRVAVVGDNFSVPSTRNGIRVNTTPVTPIDNSSTANSLVFDMPDPGIGQVGQRVTLAVTNASNQTASFQFQLEPALTIPTGTLVVSYVNPPAGTAIAAGIYDFGYRLIADVDQDSQVQLAATSSGSGWTSTLIDPQSGNPITQPIQLQRSSGTHFERTFLVRITVPGTGPAATVINVGATELTAGTHVTPAPTQALSLTLGQPAPVPENRVAVNFLSTSSNVTFSGGTAVFTRGTLGRIDFEVLFTGLGSGTGATSFNVAFALGTSSGSGWQLGAQTTTTIQVTGAQGNGSTGIRVTPPNSASSAELQLRVTGQPTSQAAVDVTYRIPMETS